MKSEPLDFVEKIRHSPQFANDSYESHISSCESLPSSASPVQEVGITDELFPYIDDMFEFEKIKFMHDLPSIDDINDVFGVNNDPQFPLLTPTISSINFFC